jgi:riboflavin synthase
MFTGLVETLGTIQNVREEGPGRRLTLAAPGLLDDMKLGDSVAVNGCCLTVVELTADGFSFEAGPETLRLTNLGELKIGDRVNLERSLKLGDRLGGHLVTGHIDGLGRIAEKKRDGDWEFIWFGCSVELAQQMAPKGSVAVDGISLTLVDVKPNAFSVALIPHTLAVTTLGFKNVGASVNLETDLLAKYVWKCLHP